jgi:hypothetical protein
MKKLLLIVVLLCGSAFAGTCGNGYTYSVKFTVPTGNNPNTDQTNFPVGLAFNGANPYNSYYFPDLATVANGGKIQNTANNSISVSGPADLIFCDAASAGNTLKFEVGKYSATTGAMEAFVKIPTLSHTVNNSFWMFYGNSGVVTTQQDLSMWADGLYVAVYHYTSGSAGKDSTGTNDLTNTGATSSSTNSVQGDSAVFGGAASMAASTSTGLGISTLTAETWTNIVTNGAGNANTYLTTIIFNVGGFTIRNLNAQMDFWGNYAGNNWVDRTPGAFFSTGVWQHAAATITGTTRLYYRNAVSQSFSTVAGSASTLGTTINSLIVGQQGGGSQFVNAAMDETRISSTVRSADWLSDTIGTTYSPSTYSILNGPSTGARVVQYITCTGTTTAVCTLPNAVSSGNTLIAITSVDASFTCVANTTFVDTRSTTFSTLVNLNNPAGSQAGTCTVFGVLGSSGSEAITTNGGVNNYTEVYEISGITSPSVDVTNSAAGNGTSPVSTGAATATTANSILVCASAYNDGSNIDNPITTFSPASTAAMTLNNAPLSAGAAGASILQFTGSGSKSCSFTYRAAPARSAVTLGVIKYTPTSVPTKRRASQIF